MKTLKIGLGVALLFLLVALTGVKKNNKFDTLKGGETKIESPIIID